YMKSNYPFHIESCKENIQVITGEKEGIYGWLAINYLMGGFEVDSDQNDQNLHTFGFLDMGGASAQIAFEPEHHQRQEHSDDLTQVTLKTLDGKRLDYDVFVTTFLGYGSNEARRRYLEERMRTRYAESNDNQLKDMLDDKHALHLDDPCLPRDLNVTDTTSTSVALSLHGTGSFSECLSYTLPLLNKTVSCPTEPCLFNGVHTPSIDFQVNRFVGISEYWYSSHDILGLGGVYDFVEFEKKATDFCASKWDFILADHQHEGSASAGIEVQRLEMQCFKAAWIVNVLHNGIGLPRIVDPGGAGSKAQETEILEQSKNSVESKHWKPPLQSINTINDIQVSWTLGVALLEASKSLKIVDNGSSPNHNTDDERPHPIGEHGLQNSENIGTIADDGGQLPPIEFLEPESQSGRLLGKYDQQSTFGLSIVIVFMILSCIGVWLLYRQRNRKRRGVLDSSDYRRLDRMESAPNGPPPPYSPPALSYVNSLLRRATHPLGNFAHLLRQMLSHDEQTLPEYNLGPNDGSIPLQNNPSIVIQNNITLRSAPPRPPIIGRNYWRKKRYSGDSSSIMSSPTGAASSALTKESKLANGEFGLSSRNNSFTNLANRSKSSNDIAGTYADAQPSTNVMHTSHSFSHVDRPRSRVGLPIVELDEDEFHPNIPRADKSRVTTPPRQSSEQLHPPPSFFLSTPSPDTTGSASNSATLTPSSSFLSNSYSPARSTPTARSRSPAFHDE
ncbi:hypothetical protein BZG36_05607, partial [Bifiguratus adelaidae]